MPKNVRLGIVGLGNRGRDLLKIASSAFEGVEAVALCEKNQGLLSSAREEFPKAESFNDFDTMLKKVKLDALMIETPATLHAEFASKALLKGINVISDIPCVYNLDDAWSLWKAQERSKAFYMTGANPNFWAFVETAVDLKRKGLLGSPYYIDAEYIHDIRKLFGKTPWRASFESIRYCTHSLGPMLRLIDEDFEWASCFDTGSHINKKDGQHDVMVALFRTRSNVVMRLTTSFINNYPWAGHHYRLFTTTGAFERTTGYGKDCPERTLFCSSELYGCKGWTELPSDLARPEHAVEAINSGHGGADYAMLNSFFKAVRSGGPSPISLRDGLRMTLPGIYAAASARKGGHLERIEYPWTTNLNT